MLDCTGAEYRSLRPRRAKRGAGAVAVKGGLIPLPPIVLPAVAIVNGLGVLIIK